MVIGQKKYTGINNTLEKRVIEIVGEKSKVRSFENNLKNFQEKKDYLISDNGLGEKVYTIYSSELKKGVCEVLKGSIRISNVGNEEFVVKINRGSEEDMENFDFGGNSNFDKKGQKGQITYPNDGGSVSTASQIKDLTEEEAQKLKNEGVEFISSSQRKKEEKLGKKFEDNVYKQVEKPKKDDSQGDKKNGGGNLGMLFGIIGFGLIGLAGVVGARIITK